MNEGKDGKRFGLRVNVLFCSFRFVGFCNFRCPFYETLDGYLEVRVLALFFLARFFALRRLTSKQCRRRLRRFASKLARDGCCFIRCAAAESAVHYPRRSAAGGGLVSLDYEDEARVQGEDLPRADFAFA